jgi:hypothetical protein
MKQLRTYNVAKGKAEGRVQLTLETADGMFEVWLQGEEAERLAADILSARFNLGALHFIAPRKKRKRAPAYIAFLSEPRVGDARPFLSEQTIKTIKDPNEQARVRKEMARLQQQQAKRQAKRGPPRSGFKFETVEK